VRRRAGSVSNDHGLFEVRGMAAGVYRIRVDHLGYEEYLSAALEVAMGEILDVEIRLSVEAIPLEPLEVLARRSPMHGRIARFENRMNDPGRAGGYFITEQEIDRRVMSTPASTRPPSSTRIQRMGIAAWSSFGRVRAG
jgi:hypothetical protein